MNQPFYSSPAFAGSDDNIYDSSGIAHLGAPRKPCLICGHPTGDCVDKNEDNSDIKIFGYNTGSSLDEKQTYTVTEDFWIEHEIMPNVNTRILKYKKGKIIPLSTAKEFGLI